MNIRQTLFVLSSHVLNKLIFLGALLLFAHTAFAHKTTVRDTSLDFEIQQLQKAVAKEPTDVGNYASRLAVFWRWANAYALTGLPIDPDVPATVARIRDPGPKSAISDQDLADIDRWVREFSYREQNVTAIGTFSSPRLGGFEVDKHHSLELEYTIGERAFGAGDGFVLGELTYGKGPLLQARDPLADNYVSIRSSVPGVIFEIDAYPIRGMFSGTMKRSVVMTGPAQKVFFRVKEGVLPTGAKVHIVLGDQRHGSRGLGLIAPSVDALRFRMWLHLDREDLLMSLPELQFASVGAAVNGVRLLGPSVVATGEAFDLTLRFEDQFRNLATGSRPGVHIMLGNKLMRRVRPGEETLLRLENFRLDTPGVYRFRVEPMAASSPLESLIESNPVVAEENPSQRLYWGETHGHSGFSEGMGSVDGVYQFARDQARLDFMALTEHDYWMDDAEWETLRSAAIKYNDPGEFLAFLAYEWTVNSPNGGHHNILYRTPNDRHRVPRQEVQTLAKLYEKLNESTPAEDLLIIPHAHNPGDWSQNDEASEKFVEIVSLHGTFEWFGRRYLDEGFMVGFLGGSDDHMGHPGLRPLRRNPTSDNFGGLLGLYAKEKSNDAVFDAMRNIQGYATNGVRSILDLRMNEYAMGTQQPSSKAAHFTGRVHATAPIEDIVLIKNGEIAYMQDFASLSEPNTDEGVLAEDINWIEIRFWSDSNPAHKGALARQWRRWRGSAQLLNAQLLHVESPQNDNKYTEFVTLHEPAAQATETSVASAVENNGQQADFFLKTRGSYKSIVMQLEDVDDSSKLRLQGVKESPLSHEVMRTLGFEISLSDLAHKAMQLDAGDDDHILVRRIRRPQQQDVEIDINLEQGTVPGDYYFLRVRQSDGGLVWSSPFRVK